MSAFRQMHKSLRLEKRSMESLLGICQGIMADNHLNDDEIMYLQCWLEDHRHISRMFPADILIANIQEALEDGVISEEERENITQIIKSIIGGTMQESGAVSGLSMKLPINKDADVVVKNRNFCFTGTFQFGNRKQCEQATRDAGGMVSKSVTQALNYLVLGKVATPSWANTSFGRKIEKAVLYQKKRMRLSIIDEAAWLAALKSA